MFIGLLSLWVECAVTVDISTDSGEKVPLRACWKVCAADCNFAAPYFTAM